MNDKNGESVRGLLDGDCVLGRRTTDVSGVCTDARFRVNDGRGPYVGGLASDEAGRFGCSLQAEEGHGERTRGSSSFFLK